MMNANINDIETFNDLHRYICPCENMDVTEYTCITLHKCCECGMSYTETGGEYHDGVISPIDLYYGTMSSTLAGRKQAIWLEYEQTMARRINGEDLRDELIETEMMFPDVVGYMKPYRF